MRLIIVCLISVLASTSWGQTSVSCSCSHNPPGPPSPRSLKPYAGIPEDLRPFSKFITPYYEFYQDLIEYNGAARETPDPNLKDLSEIRIGFIGPLSNHPDQSLGYRMLKRCDSSY